MLVLSRKVGEKVVITGDICVTVVAIQGNRVRLGITAPASVRVDRAEIHQRLQVVLNENAACQAHSRVTASRSTT